MTERDHAIAREQAASSTGVCRDCLGPLRSGSLGFCPVCDESRAREGGAWQGDEVVLGWRGEGSTPRVVARRGVEDEEDDG